MQLSRRLGGGVFNNVQAYRIGTLVMGQHIDMIYDLTNPYFQYSLFS